MATYTNLRTWQAVETLADDASVTTIPSGVSGFGFAQAGDNEEYALFSFSTDGTVVLIANSANAVNTNTDTKFCIFDNGTGIRIRNRLGAEKSVKYQLFFA